MVWPDGHGMVYGMALRAWHGVWYGITVKPCRHGMVYGNSW